MAIQSVVNVNVGQTASPPSNEVAAGSDVGSTASNSSTVAHQPVSSPEPVATAQEVRQAADKINKVLQRFNSSNLEFSVDHDSGRTIVRVVDVTTKNVIRQIPNEETLAIAKSLDTFEKGFLIRQKA